MTTEECVQYFCARGRFDEAFQAEHHNELEELKQDLLIRDKITLQDARMKFLKLRSEWTALRKVDLSVWTPSVATLSD